ncbi:hypothetical protein B0H19DRAFT_1382731 [Mycena capillaripes]|nr:hypothetical protein B0H19DRAFT_1382731 [Mycena capillaripes]
MTHALFLPPAISAPSPANFGTAARAPAHSGHLALEKIEVWLLVHALPPPCLLPPTSSPNSPHTHPPLAYLHLIEPRISGDVTRDTHTIKMHELNDALCKVEGAGGVCRMCVPPDLPALLEQDVLLTPPNSATFNIFGGTVRGGYIDHIFATGRREVTPCALRPVTLQGGGVSRVHVTPVLHELPSKCPAVCAQLAAEAAQGGPGEGIRCICVDAGDEHNQQ